MMKQPEYKSYAQLETENVMLRGKLDRLNASHDHLLHTIRAYNYKNCDNCDKQALCVQEIAFISFGGDGSVTSTENLKSCSAFKPKEQK